MLDDRVQFSRNADYSSKITKKNNILFSHNIQMTLEYSSLKDSFPQVADVSPGAMAAQKPRENNGWYVTDPVSGSGPDPSCVYLGQDGAGLEAQLKTDGAQHAGAAHRGGGGLRPGNNHPSGTFVPCRSDGSDVMSFCVPRGPRQPFDPKPTIA